MLLTLLESLFGGSIRKCSYLYTLGQRLVLLYSGKVILFNRVCSRKDAHGAMREEGDTYLASQMNQMNPGDQWDDRWHSQIALTATAYYS